MSFHRPGSAASCVSTVLVITRMNLSLFDLTELAELQISPHLAIENDFRRDVLPAFDLPELLGLVLAEPAGDFSHPTATRTR